MTSVEYILKAQDMLSGPLANASRAAENVSGSVENINRGVNNVSRVAPGRIQRLTTALDYLRERQSRAFDEKRIGQYNVAIRRTQAELTRLQNLPPSGFMNRMQSSVTTANTLQSSIRNVVGAIALFRGVKGIVNMGMQLEKTQIGFEVMLGSADKAKKLIDDINKFSKLTPFDPEGLQENAKLLLNFGVAQEKVMPHLKMIGDIAMGDANKMSALTLAFSQMSSTGRLMGQDLNQMINAGFNPLLEMSKMTGKSLAVLKDEMSAGSISVEMVEAAFENATGPGGQFFQMMEKMSASASGRLSTLIGDLQLIGAEIGMKLLPVLSSAIEFLIPVAHWIGENSDMILLLTGVITGAVLAFKAISVAISIWTAVTKAGSVAQWLLNAAMTANPIGLVIAAIAILVAYIAIAINKFDQFGSLMLFLMGPIGMLINAIIMMRRHWDSVVSAFKDGGIIEGLKRIGIVLLDTILYPIQRLLEILSHIPYLGHLAEKGAGVIEEMRDRLNLKTEKEDKKEKKGTGMSPQGSLGAGIVGGADGAGDYDPGQSVGAIAGGGAKETNITINLNREMVGQITINPLTMTQGADDVRAMLVDALSRVLNSANQMAL